MDDRVYAADAFFGNVRATALEDAGSGYSQGVSPGGTAGGGLLSGGADRIYYTPNVDGEPGLYALSKTDGTVGWTTDVPATITGRPVVADETVLLPTEDGVRCFAPADGSKRWERSDIGTRFIVADDLLYVPEDGRVRAFRPPKT